MNAAAAALLATTAIQAAASAAMLTLPALAPLVAADLRLPTSLVGTYLSLTYVGAAASALIGGAAVLRVGALRLSQLGLLACALGLLLGLVPAVLVVALSAVVLGIGYGPITPASSHLLARTASPARLGLTFSIKQTGVPLGVMVAAFLMPPLTLAGGAPLAYGVVAALAIAMLLFLQTARPTWDDDRNPGASLRGNPLAGLPMIWRHPLLRWLSVSAFCYAFCQLCVTSFTVTMLVTEMDLGLVEAGLLLSLVQFSGVVSRIGFGLWADRKGSALVPLALVGAGTALMCAITALLDPGWSRTALWLLLVMLGGTAVGWTGMFVAEVARIAPRGQVGLATGSAIAFNFLGILAGPAIFAILYPWAGSYAHTFGWLAGVPAIGALLVFHTLRIERRAQRALDAR